jgi:ubiquinone/menaquinone biosynthesis C-methylase UbiE
MSSAINPYDEHAEFYVQFVDRGLASEDGRSRLFTTLLDCLGDRLKDARVCDLCCGEGYVGRRLLGHGAREVVGIDLSSALIEVAKRRANAPGLSYRVEDAQELRSVADAEFDVVVCHMAMMDVADHKRLFASVRRVLARSSSTAAAFRSPSRCNATPPKDTGTPEATASEAEWAPTTGRSPPT